MAKTPHKHADLIKAWADGAKIEWLRVGTGSGDGLWEETPHPGWRDEIEYRLKHEPVVKEVYTLAQSWESDGGPRTGTTFSDRSLFRKDGAHNLKLTFIDGKLEGAEVLK